MDRDTTYDVFYDQLIELLEMFGKFLERYRANKNADDGYFGQPMHLSEQEQTQDQEDEQDMYDAQESIEDDGVSDQNCLISYVRLVLC